MRWNPGSHIIVDVRISQGPVKTLRVLIWQVWVGPDHLHCSIPGWRWCLLVGLPPLRIIDGVPLAWPCGNCIVLWALDVAVIEGMQASAVPMSLQELEDFQICVDPVIIHLEMRITDVLGSKTLSCCCCLCLPATLGALVFTCGFLPMDVS